MAYLWYIFAITTADKDRHCGNGNSNKCKRNAAKYIFCYISDKNKENQERQHCKSRSPKHYKAPHTTPESSIIQKVICSKLARVQLLNYFTAQFINLKVNDVNIILKQIKQLFKKIAFIINNLPMYS